MAALLHTYFGYQGTSEMRLEKDKTWNGMLAEVTAKNHALLGDCDILSTHAFIYLKYLGFHPVLIICQLNSSGNDPIRLGEKMHANLYLKTKSGYLIFDPTLFTRTFPKEAADNPARSSGVRSVDRNSFKNNEDYTIIDESRLDTADVKFFTLPEGIAGPVLDISATDRQGARLAKIIIELLLFDKEQSDKAKTAIKSVGVIFSTVVRFSIFSFLLSALLSKLYLITRRNRKGLLPMSGRAAKIS